MPYKKLTREVFAEINLKAFTHNLEQIKQRLNVKTDLLLVLKADAYGHGALKLGKCALKQGINYFAVATFDEAMELKRAFKDVKILILGSTPLCNAKKIIKHDIELCIYDEAMAKELSKEAEKQNKKALIHIKLDTGMNRIGYQYSKKSLESIYCVAGLANIKIRGIFTHFATADSQDLGYLKTQEQYFQNFISDLKINTKNTILHCANSAAILSAPQSHYDLVRLGIMSYGLKPSLQMNMQNLNLKAVMSLKANIVHIKDIKKGESVSYGRTFTASKAMKIATLPLGYADGYMRLLSNKAQVLIRGQRANIVGNICMDQCMVDVSEIKGVSVGDRVLLFGYDDLGNELSVDELAKHINSINYELVCAISKRVPRVYIDDNK